MLQEVRQCRWDKCYDNSKVKIILAMEGTQIRPLVLTSLMQLGGEVRSGRPPPGQLEHELASWLDVLQ